MDVKYHLNGTDFVWNDRKAAGPDGHFNFPHLWPVKLPHGGRPDYDDSALMAMRAAASLSR